MVLQILPKSCLSNTFFPREVDSSNQLILILNFLNKFQFISFLRAWPSIWDGLARYAGLARLSEAIFLFDYISRAGKKKSREIRIKMAEQDIDKEKLIVIASLES